MLVKAPYIEEASLRDPVPVLLRPYGLWFGPLYSVFYHYYTNEYDKYIQTSQWTILYLGLILSLHAVVWLMPFWNISVRTLFETTSASDPHKAKLIKLKPSMGNGAPDIVPIKQWANGEISFVYQQRCFMWNEKLQCFQPPHFWVYDDNKIGDVLKMPGLSASAENRAHLEKEFGPNIFNIPIPTFAELWKEHAVAPFFVFQIFSVVLWLLDEKWKSSLFSLFMIISFESTVVFQRRQTMREFRSMGIKPYEIYVYRSKAWTKISTKELQPGDIVSVARSPEDSGIPCDLVLLSGSAVVNEAMLSGESTPLLKESIADRDVKSSLDIDGIDKNSLLSGGTKALQITSAPMAHISAAPDQGAIAVVARTGFETTQGQLVRTMIFSAERVGSGNKEAYFFILFLLVFAVAASWYVWVNGVEMGRPRAKLLLDCVLIITSVVPPELPMELTLAVNSSLNALMKFYIYCTEPFRIPFAGRVDVCCFDKTGTLTEEDLIVEGVAGLPDNVPGERLPNGLLDIKHIPGTSALVLAAAHALVLLDDGEVVGDPMEQTTLKSIGWKVLANDQVQCIDKPKSTFKILKRFQFSSALKRSSSIATMSDDAQHLLVAVKGAPETIQSMLTEVPPKFEETFKHYTREGSRVLAFAYKTLPSSTKLTHYTRDSAEGQLKFAGFLVFHCPIKPDAIETIKMLNESSHRTVMITGDNPLTAVKVASQVGIVERQTLVLDIADGSERELVWTSPDETVVIPYSSGSKGYELYSKYDLCLTGHALAELENTSDMAILIRHTWVYARVSPNQKEFILKTLNNEGYMTLMCGDGTNDVGALKQANLGVALLNGTEDGMKKLADKARCDAVQKVYEKQCDMMKRWGGKPPPVPAPIAHLYPPGPGNPHYVKTVTQRGGTIDEETLAKIKAMSTLDDQSRAGAAGFADKLTEMMGEEDEGEAPQIKLGDASCAAPLTSKLRDVSAVTRIIRQGRCTLVATIQMYKILALNCLISAYTFSVLFLAGIKMSDGQSLIAGVLISMCFTSISRARANDKLSKERPQPGIFNVYIMGSILGQFAVHVVSLIYVSGWCYALEPRTENSKDLDSAFEPSLLNTAMYLIQLIQQISTIAVNYQGKPFRESLSENRLMYWGIMGCLALGFAGATELLPEMNEALSLVKMPAIFKTKLTAMMLLDLGLCYGIEYGLKYLFSDFKASRIALRREERGTEIVQLHA